MESNFYDVFPRKKVLIGMLYLSGNSHSEKIERAVEEAGIYNEEGFDGAIVEDYHGDLQDVISALDILQKQNLPLIIGVNVLRDPYLAFGLAGKYGAKFVQFDTIQASSSNSANNHRFNEKMYFSLKERYPHICILGGVRFKYVPPTGKSLADDLCDGMYKADAIVTTGEGTGIETPIQKLRDFRKVMETFPLIVGAGINDRNVKEQMEICEGAIVGSYIKGGETEAPVQREKVRRLVDLVRG